MNQFWMSATRNSKTWVTILSKTVGSTTSLMFRPVREGWQGAMEKCSWETPRVLLHFFFRPHGQGQHCNGLAMWRGHVLNVFGFHFGFSPLLLSFSLVSFSIYSCIFTFMQLVVLGGPLIACRSIQRHIVALESDIDIYKSVMLPIREPDHEDRFLFLIPGRWQSAILICRVCKFVICFKFFFFHSYLLSSKLLTLSNVVLFLSCLY